MSSHHNFDELDIFLYIISSTGKVRSIMTSVLRTEIEIIIKKNTLIVLKTFKTFNFLNYFYSHVIESD